MSFELEDLAPTGSSGVLLNPQQLINHLLLIWSIKYIEESPTRYTEPGKPCDVIVVDVVDLDQVNPDTNQPGLLARGCWWRQNRLILALREKVGNPNPILVKLIKVGQPYDLEQMKGDRMAVTRAANWFQNNPDFRPSVPRVDRVETAKVEPVQTTVRNGGGPMQQIPETPLERQARLAAGGQEPTSEILNSLRTMGKMATPQDGPIPY